MKIYIYFLFISLITAIQPVSIAQTFQSSSKEIGYQIGTSYYLGDLNPNNPLGGRQHVTQGGYYRHHFNSRVGVRLQLLQGVVEAWDEDSENGWAQNRNLHVRNKIVEFSVSGEINYIDHVMGDPGDRLTGYLSAGIAYFTHDPEAQDSYGNWHPLQPLGTEGQGWVLDNNPYKLSGLAIPIGMGFKMNVGPAIAFQIEWGLRKTWTDYLDDVSRSYVSPVEIRQSRGDLAFEMADRILALPEGVSSAEGLQRGDSGLDDKYGYFLASIAFRVSKKPTSCWNQ